MTQTTDFELDQLVQIEGRPTVEFYWITRLPEEGSETFTVFGGRKIKGGHSQVWTRSVYRRMLQTIETPALRRKAEETRLVIESAMAEMPKARAGKPGRK